MNALSTMNVLNSIISINRFNNGGADDVFSEVKSGGIRIVVKNDEPECVLISPIDYKNLLEEYEDLLLAAEAQKRLNDHSEPISHEDLMKKYGITNEDLDDVEVELE